MQSPGAFDRKLMTNDSSSMNGIFNWNANNPNSNSAGRGALHAVASTSIGRSMNLQTGFVDINEIPPAGMRTSK